MSPTITPVFLYDEKALFDDEAFIWRGYEKTEQGLDYRNRRKR
jgi:hypothetical protein